MHGLIFETSIWLLAGSTRLVSRNKENENLSWEKKSQTKHRWHSIVLKTTPKTNSHSNQDSRENEFFWTHKTWKKFKLKSDNQIGISIERLPEKYSVKPNTIRMNPSVFQSRLIEIPKHSPNILNRNDSQLRNPLLGSWSRFPLNYLTRDKRGNLPIRSNALRLLYLLGGQKKNELCRSSCDRLTSLTCSYICTS